MLEKYPEIMTVNELMQTLRIGRNKAYELISTKKIKSFGSPIRILKQSLIEYINNNQN